jgi:hypothetical protein
MVCIRRIELHSLFQEKRYLSSNSLKLINLIIFVRSSVQVYKRGCRRCNASTRYLLVKSNLNDHVNEE